MDALSIKAAVPDAYVCATLSANGTDKLTVFRENAKQRDVVLFFDRDEAGHRAAADAYEALAGNCRAVNWTVAPEGCKDPSDLLVGGHADTIRRMVEAAERPPSERCQEQEEPEPDFSIKEWPKLNPLALRGIAGRFVELATGASEADPVAVLATFLSRFGVEVGTCPHLMIGDTEHAARLNVVIVGSTSKARKGTSGKPVRRLFKFDSEGTGLYRVARISPGPLSSGEGLIYAVRDPSYEWNPRKQEAEQIDQGVEDKRLFVLDEEFAAALRANKREGNTLSVIIRSAWDSGDLEPLTKHNRIKATGAHVGIATHITFSELLRLLDQTEAISGFGNRLLWVVSRRRKLIALPRPMPREELRELQRELLKIVSTVQQFGEVTLSKEATDLWERIYPELSTEHPGLVGAIINRSEAQVMRLSLVYSLLDAKDVIEGEHLEAALAFWQYTEDSARYIFGRPEAHPVPRRILELLEQGPKTLTDMHKMLSQHVNKEKMEEAINELIAAGRVTLRREKTGGRPKTVLELAEKAEKGQ